jgi:flagellar basal body-associated protein FliL
MREIVKACIALMLLAAASLSTAPAWAQPSGGHGGSESSGQTPQSRQERLTSAETYLPLPTFSTSVLQNGVSRGTLIVDLGLDIPDAALRARAQSAAPRLRDAMRTALSVYAGSYFRAQTAPDPAQLGRILQQNVDRTLGAPGARVLFTNIVYQGGGRRT